KACAVALSGCDSLACRYSPAAQPRPRHTAPAMPMPTRHADIRMTFRKIARPMPVVAPIPVRPVFKLKLSNGDKFMAKPCIFAAIAKIPRCRNPPGHRQTHCAPGPIGPGRCARYPKRRVWTRSRRSLAGNFVVYAFDVPVHAQNLAVVERGAALAFD